MRKKDILKKEYFIIAKCFSEQDLKLKELNMCKEFTQLYLMNEHGLTDIQANRVLNWCLISEKKLKNGFINSYDTKE